MFSRKIRSQIDVMVPSCLLGKRKDFSEFKAMFSENRVVVHDYLFKTKWRFGTVIKVEGKVHK